MRLISFSLTKRQFRARTKTVTRRLGWEMLRAGDELMGCEKVMGRKRGEALIRMGAVRVTVARRESLRRMTDDPEYGAEECIREGFPEMTPQQFVEFFCASHKGCTPDTTITRIAFEYL